MAVNKVNYGGKALINLTKDTVSESSLLSGYTAHKKDGTVITGSFLADLPAERLLSVIPVSRQLR